MFTALTPLITALPLAAISAAPALASVSPVHHPSTPFKTTSAQALVSHGSRPNLAVPIAVAPPTPAPAAAPAFAVYAGYMDSHHHGSSKPKPSPWLGSPNVVFVGKADTSAGGWDASAVRVDNLSHASEQVTVTVDIGKHHYDLWGTQTVPAGQSLVLTQMGSSTFDGSDTNPAGGYSADPALCQTSVSATVPVVHVTVDGVTTDVRDVGQVLNTGGVDAAGCPYTGARDDESEPWSRLV